MARTVPMTVVETPEFLSATRKLMTDDQRALLVDYLAYNPTSGDLIPGTGGVRKLRAPDYRDDIALRIKAAGVK